MAAGHNVRLFTLFYIGLPLTDYLHPPAPPRVYRPERRGTGTQRGIVRGIE